MNKVTNLLDKYKLPIYNERKISGIRTVMIRRALGSNQVQLIFVTSNPVSLTKLVKELTLSYPEIVTVAVNYNYSKSSEIYGQETEIIWGQETITSHFLLVPSIS